METWRSQIVEWQARPSPENYVAARAALIDALGNPARVAGQTLFPLVEQMPAAATSLVSPRCRQTMLIILKPNVAIVPRVYVDREKTARLAHWHARQADGYRLRNSAKPPG
jgi:hypothetical protein